LKLRVAITGQNGFVGVNIYNALKTYSDKFLIVYFNRSFFDNTKLMSSFVKECDVIIHTAAVSRSDKTGYIYDENMRLVKNLLSAIKRVESKPYIIFTSSVHENQNSEYGASKKDGDLLFKKWACKFSASYTNIILPNVFGPFSKPHYASFIATFCDLLAKKNEPTILVDNNVKLIYIGNLVSYLLNLLDDYSKTKIQILNKILIPNDFEISVTSILVKLKEYQKSYVEKGLMPKLKNENDYNLFRTFHSFLKVESLSSKFVSKNFFNNLTFLQQKKLEIFLKSNDLNHSSHSKLEFSPSHNFRRLIVISGNINIIIKGIRLNDEIVINLDEKSKNCIDIPVWHSFKIVKMKFGHCNMNLIELV
jgi:UDP-2-acetamido-2,6-beta-L-arabino-hexul-4-ose reductase